MDVRAVGINPVQISSLPVRPDLERKERIMNHEPCDTLKRADMRKILVTVVVTWGALTAAAAHLVRLVGGSPPGSPGQPALAAAASLLAAAIAAALPSLLGWMSWAEAGLGRHGASTRRVLWLTASSGLLCLAAASAMF